MHVHADAIEGTPRDAPSDSGGSSSASGLVATRDAPCQSYATRQPCWRARRRALRRATATGEVIEDYPDDLRGPSCLVFLRLPPAGEPVHVVYGYDDEVEWTASCFDYYAELGRDLRGRVIAPGFPHQFNAVVLVTVYRPDPQKWSADFRTRRLKR